ncbi:MAG: hypothetical protein H6907_13405 [Hyphomicrobiales bacterium]|nr:hypothetical protein [Hyphomicrobiales bacterium]MCP5372721.1 hypothetical protein [Hyphomicrobiales bacterium]
MALAPLSATPVPQPAGATTTRSAPGNRLVGGSETPAVALYGSQAAGSYERAARLTEDFGSEDDRRRAAQRAALFSGEARRGAAARAASGVSRGGPVLEAGEGTFLSGVGGATTGGGQAHALAALVTGIYEATGRAVAGAFAAKGAVLDLAV